MKLLLFIVLLLNLAYAQSDQEIEQKPKQQKQEAKSANGAIENPFDYGPYKGNEYVPFDRLRNEKAESKEQREDEEANQSQI